MADDPLALDPGADHEAGHVGEEEQRHVEGVAGLDEAGRLVGRVDEEDAAGVLGLVGDDADDAAVEPPVADDQLFRPALVHRQEAVGVEQRVEQQLHVEGPVLVLGDDLGDRRLRGRLGGWRQRRLLLPAARHEGEVALGEVDRLLVAA